jgi:predicted negative regulator of RcsB-dependent stress response
LIISKTEFADRRGFTMPTYETDNEQMEMLKKWWGDYGKWLVIAVIIGLAAGLGWRYWQQQQIRVRQQASLLYQQLIVADSDKNRDTVMQMAAELTQRYPHTEYAALGNLVAAKNAVNANNLAVTQQKLQWTLEHSKSEAVRQIARLRESRLLLALNKPDEAQKLLSVVEDKTFQPAIDEVQGDIYLARGDRARAHQSYQSAQTGLSAFGGEDVLLSLKLAQP